MKQSLTTSIFSIGIFSMLVFGVFTFMPKTTHACDYYDCSYDYSYDYGYDYGYDSGCSYGCGGYDYNYYPPVTRPAPAPRPIPQPPHTSPLQVSCYPMPLSSYKGDSVSWVANAYGGSDNYSYTWSGTDGLTGAGSAITKVYYNPGYKNATVVVRSGNQTISKNCDGSVNVIGDTYSYNPPAYYPPTYYPPTTYYAPVTVSCTANTNYSTIGNQVTWTAYASGGNGYFNYSWSGSDGINGTGQYVYQRYNIPGPKYASVTVTSNGQSITQGCSNTVSVSAPIQPIYQTPVVVSSNNNSLDVGCFADPSTSRINQPVTWNVEVRGGLAPYVYSWTGSDGLNGSQSSIIKYYSSAGEKSAIVTVTSADGKNVTRACTNTASVRSNTVATRPASVQAKIQNPANNNNGLSASALFSLQNIPWGWIAILIILVLFATVMYLIFNREKI